MRTVEIGDIAKSLDPIASFNKASVLIGVFVIGGAAENLVTREFFRALVMFALLAPTAWLFWRTADPIKAVFSRLALSSYIFVAVIAAVGSLLGVFSLFAGRMTLSALILMSCAIYVPVAIRAAIGLRRLRKFDIAPFGVSLRELMRSAGESLPGKATPKCARVNPTRGWLFLAAAALPFIFVFVNIMYSPESESISWPGTLFNVALFVNSWKLVSYFMALNAWTIAGCYLLLKSRANFQPKAESLLSVDRRPAILFLRSFSDDEKLRLSASRSSLFDFSLEGRLTGHFAASGPFIAIGSTDHETPPAGAARAYFSDDQWQGEVGQWMQTARLIILVAGMTKWVGWELEQALRRGDAGKLIVLFPEKVRINMFEVSWRPPFLVIPEQVRMNNTQWELSAGPWWNRGWTGIASNAAARFDKVTAAFRGTPWERDLLRLDDPTRIRSLTFGPNGEVTAVCGKTASRNECHLAVLISEQLLKHPQRTEDSATSAPIVALSAPELLEHGA